MSNTKALSEGIHRLETRTVIFKLPRSGVNELDHQLPQFVYMLVMMILHFVTSIHNL